MRITPKKIDKYTLTQSDVLRYWLNLSEDSEIETQTNISKNVPWMKFRELVKYAMPE